MYTKHKHLLLMLLMPAVLTAGLAACDMATVAPQSTAVAHPALKVGFVFDLTGSNAEMGSTQKAATQLAVAEINGTDGSPGITAVYRDAGSDPAQAAAAFQKLIEVEKVHAVIGPTLSSEARRANPVAQDSKVPVLAVSNTAGGITDVGDYIFRDSLAEFQIVPELIGTAKEELHVERVSLLYGTDDPFSKAEADLFRTTLKENDIQIVSEHTFSASDKDYRPQLAAIKAESPDAIVIAALSGPAGEILSQARKEVGIGPDLFIIGGNGFSDLPAEGNSTAEGLVVGKAWSAAGNDSEMSRNFVEKYRQRYGKDPDETAAQAYAGVQIIWNAYKRANAAGKTLERVRTDLRDALKGSDQVQTVLGPFSFTDKRDARHAPAILLVKDGRPAALK